jgi:hypothetical protein
MKFTKAVAIFVVALYVFLWVLALNGVDSLIGPLAVPLILIILVALLVWLQRFIGITPKSPRFVEPEDDKDPK